jgi:hypothetical protein
MEPGPIPPMGPPIPGPKGIPSLARPRASAAKPRGMGIALPLPNMSPMPGNCPGMPCMPAAGFSMVCNGPGITEPELI